MSEDRSESEGDVGGERDAAFWRRLFIASVVVFSVLTTVLALQTWNLHRRVMLLEETRRTAAALGVSERCVAELERCDELVETCLSVMAFEELRDAGTPGQVAPP